MQSYFRVFKELVFFNFWILVSGFRIPDSGFRVLGLPWLSEMTAILWERVKYYAVEKKKEKPR